MGFEFYDSIYKHLIVMTREIVMSKLYFPLWIFRLSVSDIVLEMVAQKIISLTTIRN